MNRIKKWFVLGLALIITGLSAGCSTARPKEPVTVTLWHVYGAQTDSPFNDLIDRFNQTVGKEQGIQVEVTFVSTNKAIHEIILSSAYGDPGSSPLPDMFVTYPKTVAAMPDDDILVNYHDYFTDEELGAMMPEFLREGEINGRLLILPVAKSTEVLYVNRNMFEQFSEETGVTLEMLSTWEGLFRAAEKYAEWTDSKTPDIPGDAKAMLVHDFHFNYFQVGVESLGESFFRNNTLAFGPKFKQIWEPYARAAISGGLWLKGGYATEPMRTGDTIAAIASSAGVHYFSDSVTYPDNTSQKTDWIIRPVPVFENGKHLAMQRGAGISTVRSTPEKEKACITFLKWLTDIDNNVEFTTQLGYMPVKKAAFDRALPEAIEQLEQNKYAELYRAYLKTQKEYTFYTAPQMDNYLELENRFEETVRNRLTFARNQYLRGEDDIQTLSRITLEKLIQNF